jgi:hypothetical protein
MNESVDIEAVRAEALRKLGRNIVNFSKIEEADTYELLQLSKVCGMAAKKQASKLANTLPKTMSGQKAR